MNAFRVWVSVALLGLMQAGAGAATAPVVSDFAYARVSSLGLASEGLYLNAPLLGDSNGVFFGIATRGGETNAGTVFRVNQDGTGFRVLHHFGSQIADGERPLAELVFGPDGWLYGTTELGGTNNTGTIFKLQRDGTGYQIVFHFGAAPAARYPHGHLELGWNGTFFGTTQWTRDSAYGSVFTILPDGTGFRILKDFGTQPEDGRDPDNGLTLGSDGVLYGTCSTSGPSGYFGSIFRINQDGSGYAVLHNFLGEEPGGEPKGRLLEVGDSLYGNASGLIYKIKKNGSGYTRLYTNDFTASAAGGIIQGEDGFLYWAGRQYSAISNSVTAKYFKMNLDGSSPQVFASFPVAPAPEGPVPGLPLVATHGVTRGTNGSVLATIGHGIYRVQEDGSDPVVVRHLDHTTWSPRQPSATLLRASDGLFYGTSESGGFSNAGTIFVLNANGTGYRPIYQFGRETNTSKTPNRLLEASDGLLYGVTQTGTTNNTSVIFKLRKDGSDFGILKFLSDPQGPRNALGGLIEGMDGSLYGLSSLGGTNGRGTVFKLRKDGSDVTVVRSFATSEGYSPSGELVQAADGMLYGVTQAGSIANFGTVFRIHPDGSDFGRLHDFLGGVDGQRPRAGLLLDGEGTLFGTTTGTGNPLWGTVFRVSRHGGGYEVLHQFASSGAEGRNPAGPLVEGNDGFLYGTTPVGGMTGQGTIFRLRKDGAYFSVLWHFPGFNDDGEAPFAGLTAVGDGSFLGATRNGGAYENGSVFRFDGTVVRLGIAHGPPIEVSWPASSTADQLEHSSSLNPSNWRLVNWPATLEGSNYKVIVPPDEPSFLRLRRQWR